MCLPNGAPWLAGGILGLERLWRVAGPGALFAATQATPAQGPPGWDCKPIAVWQDKSESRDGAGGSGEGPDQTIKVLDTNAVRVTLSRVHDSPQAPAALLCRHRRGRDDRLQRRTATSVGRGPAAREIRGARVALCTHVGSLRGGPVTCAVGGIHMVPLAARLAASRGIAGPRPATRDTGDVSDPRSATPSDPGRPARPRYLSNAGLGPDICKDRDFESIF